MADSITLFQYFSDYSPKVLGALLTLSIIICARLRMKDRKKIDHLKSERAILQSLDTEYGHITLYPTSVNDRKNDTFRYEYSCMLTLNIQETMPDGFHLMLSSPSEYKIVHQGITLPALFRRPHYSIYFDSEKFSKAKHCKVGSMYTLNFSLFTNERQLQVSLLLNTGSKKVESLVYLQK